MQALTRLTVRALTYHFECRGQFRSQTVERFMSMAMDLAPTGVIAFLSISSESIFYSLLDKKYNSVGSLSCQK